MKSRWINIFFFILGWGFLLLLPNDYGGLYTDTPETHIMHGYMFLICSLITGIFFLWITQSTKQKLNRIMIILYCISVPLSLVGGLYLLLLFKTILATLGISFIPITEIVYPVQKITWWDVREFTIISIFIITVNIGINYLAYLLLIKFTHLKK